MLAYIYLYIYIFRKSTVLKGCTFCNIWLIVRLSQLLMTLNYIQPVLKHSDLLLVIGLNKNRHEFCSYLKVFSH